MKLVILGLVAVFLTGCSVVQPGQKGIRYYFGAASESTKEPGTYFWIPFALGMKKIDVQVQKNDVDAEAVSKDMQETNTKLAVNWSIDSNKVFETFKTVGDEDDVFKRIVLPMSNEVLKAETAKRTVEELLTKRMELKTSVDSSLRERLKAYNIILHDVSIINFGFSKEFTKAVEEKQVAEQRAKKAEYVAQQAAVDAKAVVNKSKGDAEAMLVKAEAEAKANQLKLKTLTSELIHYEAVTRWNGQLPTMMSGNTVPFINVTPNK